MRLIAVVFAIISLVFPNCTLAQDTDDSWEVVEGDYTPNIHYQAEVLMRHMSLRDKICQMMFLCPEDLTGEIYTTQWPEEGALGSLPAGGILLFGQNIVSEDQLDKLTAGIMQDAENISFPPFLAVEEEGGAVSRVANKLGCPPQPSPAQIGSNGGKEGAYASGKAIGEYLNRFRINLDLAPDADVLTVPGNELNDRCFGSDAKTVSGMALAFANGLKDSGVAACYKHFPGQGSAVGSLYKGRARSRTPLDDMTRAELIPFADGIKQGIPMILVSHMEASELDDGCPASLSYAVITELLRNTMGFDGVIVTDSLRGTAIRSEGETERLAVKCVLAGADMIMLPSDAGEAVQGLLTAVGNGTISEERINESVERILIMKAGMGLIQ